MAHHRKSCALKNERKYTLKEVERVALHGIREKEKKWIMIQCEHGNEPQPKGNISRGNWTSNSR